MSAPHLSVVIPSYNYGRYLDECLRSIYSQENAPSFEVIVVDDGSTDDSVERLAAWGRANLHVVARKKNFGHVATINEALPLAQGAIIARIDPDDRYHPRFMATVCDRFERYPDVGLVYGNAAIIDGAGQATGEITPPPHDAEYQGSEFLPLLERNFICAPTVAARRNIWLDVLPVPDGLAFHDWYFTLLAARRYPFCYVDDVIADYRVHNANHHSTISQNGSEERSVMWLLDKVFAEAERDPSDERRKQQARHRVYGRHYLDFAEKYFWFRRNADARRCYLAALRASPGQFRHRGVLRRLAASVVGRNLYDRLKSGHAKVATDRRVRVS